MSDDKPHGINRKKTPKKTERQTDDRPDTWNDGLTVLNISKSSTVVNAHSVIPKYNILIRDNTDMFLYYYDNNHVTPALVILSLYIESLIILFMFRFVLVPGDSAGGQLSAAVTLRMREMVDSGLPVLKLQVLLYPGLQMFNLQSPSGQQNHDNAMLPIDIKPRALLLRILGNLRHSDVVAQNNHVIPAMKKQMSKTFVNVDDLPAKFINKDYTPWDTDHGNETVWRDLKDVLMNPYCCSLIAEDLTNLPAAYIFTGENDVIRDDGFWYAKRLRDAGVDVTHRAHPIAFHGIFNMLSVVDEAEECAEGVVQYIKDNI